MGGDMTALDRFSLFAGCTRRELQAIDALGAEISLPSGKAMMTQGTPGRDCFLILEGTVNVVCRGRDVATLGPGDICGEMALLNGRPRAATVLSREAMRVRVFTPAELHALLAVSPKVRSRVQELVTTRARTPSRARPVDIPRLAVTSA
jgi:CRP-like cAMP-binding protein